VTYEAVTGRLERGDRPAALHRRLVEVPGRDLAVGIDKLLGEAERLVPRGFRGGVERSSTAWPNEGSDDRGLVLVWRD
jgi:hypothetical protein